MALVFFWVLLLAYALGAVTNDPLKKQPVTLTNNLHRLPLQEVWVIENYQTEPDLKIRNKRQVQNNYGQDLGSQVINDIFQIPIQTLTAISNLFRSTRAQRTNKKRITNNQQAGSVGTAYSIPNTYYTTDNNGVNNGYGDIYSKPNRYTYRPTSYYSPYTNGVRGSRATASSIAHLSVAGDGSSFKI